jgi:hypothetical protein
MPAKSQVSMFDSLWNKLTFNIYTGKPDSVVLSFLKNHFPYLAKTPEPGGWTVYPPGAVEIPQHGMHSLRVTRHPFIETEHSGARLDLLTQEWKEGPPGIEGSRVWIYFHTKSQLETARMQLIKEFQAIGAYISPLSKTKPEKLNIKEGQEEDKWKSLSIITEKKSARNQYSMLILFYDDQGEAW